MKKYDKPDHCPICFETLEDSDCLECGHWTHVKCIQKTNKSQCVICRNTLNIKIENKVSSSSDLIIEFDTLSNETTDEDEFSINESSSEEETSFEIINPSPYMNLNQSKERKLCSDTLNHLKFCKKNNYNGEYIDEDIEFFTNIINNNECEELGTYKDLEKTCKQAIDRTYNNNFCDYSSSSDEEREEEDYLDDYSTDEEDES